MRVGIFANLTKDDGLQVTRNIASLLKKSGFDLVFHKSNAEIGGNCFDEKSMPELDVMITVGGDGTILRIATECACKNIPILGVNMGNIGFLTEVEPKKIGLIPKMLLNKDYTLDKRSLIKVSFNNRVAYGLNEVVFSRSNLGKMMYIKAEVDGKLIDRFRLDGMILSTPTGSTAYSLSAGGPVMSPEARAFALTPINSHSLHSRPIIVSDDETVTITNIGLSKGIVIVDGVNMGELNEGSVKIEKAEFAASFIRMKDSNFYSTLLTKLNKWSITE